MKNQKKLNDGAQVARKFQMGLAAACLFGALLGVVIHFPATALGSMVESQTNGTIRLTQAKGSIWDGSAGVEFAGKANLGISSMPGSVLAVSGSGSFDRAIFRFDSMRGGKPHPARGGHGEHAVADGQLSRG